jgi:hypothetical protein
MSNLNVYFMEDLVNILVLVYATVSENLNVCG